MIRYGHLHVNEYRLSFVKVVLEEIGDSIEEKLRYNSLATRLSKLEDKDFTEFMSELNTNNEPKTIDHEAQLKQFLQG